MGTQGVGVGDDTAVAGDEFAEGGAGGAQAEAGSADPGGATWIGEQLVERLVIHDEAGGDVAVPRGMPGCDDRDHAGPAVARGGGGQLRSTGHGRAAEDGDVAAEVFVRVDGVDRQAP